MGVSTATLCALGCEHRTPTIGMGVGGGVTPARHAVEQRETNYFVIDVAVSACAVDACRESKLPD